MRVQRRKGERKRAKERQGSKERAKTGYKNKDG